MKPSPPRIGRRAAHVTRRPFSATLVQTRAFVSLPSCVRPRQRAPYSPSSSMRSTPIANTSPARRLARLFLVRRSTPGLLHSSSRDARVSTSRDVPRVSTATPRRAAVYPRCVRAHVLLLPPTHRHRAAGRAAVRPPRLSPSAVATRRSRVRVRG
jgi:hypothetical protein